MELVSAYMTDEPRREALNALCREVFGFDFRDWYDGGGFEGGYIPFSYVEDGRVVSNASANLMVFSQNGLRRRYIQIGTVMTDPAYRRRGLAGALIRRILDVYRDCDGFFLFGDLSAAEFYKGLGFQAINEYKYTLKREFLPLLGTREDFRPLRPDELSRYRETLGAAAVNSSLEQLNRRSLWLFYTAGGENILYSPSLDAYAVLEDGELRGVAARRRVELSELLPHLPRAERLSLGFAPLGEDCLFCDKVLFDGGEDYRLFCLGKFTSIEAEFLYVPVLSHA